MEAKVPSQSSTGITQRYLSEKKTTDKTMTSQDNTGGERKGIHASQKVKAMSSLPKIGSQNSQFLLLAAGLLLSGSIFSLKRNSKFRR
ncbi:LPXTG cell wall anchor domain-containing protein [Aerococcus christensenii]|uniref:LPXTG cell wall anchor domain-containing protein n=1 Tax=Aerococcus christensenii TaxID=87541 RepID=UPI0023A99D41|nr:LPXTG cell wall anchor domain-containing protein [Aerococcus christensenii]WEB71017.1 LPXTG cell wall anchor domain-containing protein [Aerococcus christensenii]